MPAAQRSAFRLALPTGLVLSLPALLFLSAFMVLPVASLLYLSFNDYSPLRSSEVKFVGLGNYEKALSDPATLHSISVTLIFTVGAVALEMLFGLLSAVGLARLTLRMSGGLSRLLSRFFASVFILPFAAPGVAAAVAWKMFLDPQIGPVDAVLGHPIAWFSSYPMLSIIIIDTWKTLPFVLFLLYAAIMSVDPAQFEAAKLDGASNWQEFRYLTFPEILPILAVTTAFRAVDAFTKAFDLILPTTGGGPGQQTMVFPLFIWRTAFVSLHFGEASALAVIAIAVSGVIGALLLRAAGKANR
jgi:ABC-type sugar transport system permease subunit